MPTYGNRFHLAGMSSGFCPLPRIGRSSTMAGFIPLAGLAREEKGAGPRSEGIEKKSYECDNEAVDLAMKAAADAAQNEVLLLHAPPAAVTKKAGKWVTPADEEDVLVNFLRANWRIFAWKPSDMPAAPPTPTSLHHNVEAYVDDVVVKTKDPDDLIADLQ
nr:unnamed protein product [Digitaria exilis]